MAGYGDLRWRWRRAFKEAAAAIGHPALRVHDLRHLAAINLVRAGLDLPSVQAHLGHKHLISTLRYAAYADATASARAARLQDDLFGEPDEDAPREGERGARRRSPLGERPRRSRPLTARGPTIGDDAIYPFENPLARR